jgi:hypothetical protein
LISPCSHTTGRSPRAIPSSYVISDMLASARLSPNQPETISHNVYRFTTASFSDGPSGARTGANWLSAAPHGLPPSQTAAARRAAP